MTVSNLICPLVLLVLNVKVVLFSPHLFLRVLGPSFHRVHHPSQFTHLISFSKSSFVYADDTQLFFAFHPSDVGYIRAYHGALQQLSSWMTSNLFVFLKNWIFLCWSSAATSQTTEYLSKYYSLCSQHWLYFRYLLWSDIITLYVLVGLLSHSSTTLRSSLP